AALAWILWRHHQGKSIIPDFLKFGAFRNGAALVAAPTPGGHVIVAVPADTPILDPGHPDGAPVLAQTPNGIVQVTIPQSTVIMSPAQLSTGMSAPTLDANGIHAPRYISGDLMILHDCEGGRRGLSSPSNPA